MSTAVRNMSTTQAIVAGATAGLAATLVMNYAQRAWTLVIDGQPPVSAGGQHDARDWQEREEGRNANELAAQAITRAIMGQPATQEQLTIAAPLVHFSFGAAVGAIYGLTIGAECRPALMRGLTFGTAVWLVADELAMPLLGLSGSTRERSIDAHAQSLVSHLVFGVAAEAVRSAALAAIGRQRYGAPRADDRLRPYSLRGS